MNGSKPKISLQCEAVRTVIGKLHESVTTKKRNYFGPFYYLDLKDTDQHTTVKVLLKCEVVLGSSKQICESVTKKESVTNTTREAQSDLDPYNDLDLKYTCQYVKVSVHGSVRYYREVTRENVTTNICKYFHTNVHDTCRLFSIAITSSFMWAEKLPTLWTMVMVPSD